MSNCEVADGRGIGEHEGRAHTDHDLAGWMDGRCGNLDPTPGEARVNTLVPDGLTPGYAQNFSIGA
ncbi:hypothetical protein [Streptosporangium roseum]|uniref:hypothetical protein n=1 Tax=Streptosporangium roseum TaxID=2001 RepID=UPI0012DCF842|nr:hypothetical protein [Streptosporangium roseum]